MESRRLIGMEGSLLYHFSHKFIFYEITILVQFVLTTRLTSRLYLLQLLDRHRNLVSKALHFSASFTALQRLSKPTPISGGWRLIPSFRQTSRILKL